jgi:uncharacterized protein
MKNAIPRMVLLSLLTAAALPADEALRTRIGAHLDGIAAIDTHDHLWRFDELPGWRETADGGREMNLASIWQNSYLSWFGVVPAWRPAEGFDGWWARAKPAFADVRAMGVYRYTLPAIRDLYGVDFEEITDGQARILNDRIVANYRDQHWLYDVITEKANIEVVVNDPYWDPYDFEPPYAFNAVVLRLNPVFRGFHPSEFALEKRPESPHDFARKEGLPMATFDDYLAFLDSLFAKAKAAGLVGLKHTLAYQRSLGFAKVEKDRAAAAYGRRRDELTPDQIRDFEDYLMWHLCELSAKHGLPFQIHTGHGRLQGSNPMLLLDLIEAHPKTTFVLFHGGVPWVTESAAIAMRHRNVYLDSVWLPTLSPALAKRALHEWLDLIPASRILWGADCNHAEGVYGATVVTRQVLADVLTERVARGDLREADALHIGDRILRENALEVFPGIRERLWRHKQERMVP